MSEDRLVRKVVALLNECRSWWAEYCDLKRKFGVEGVGSSRLTCNMEVVGLHATWK